MILLRKNKEKQGLHTKALSVVIVAAMSLSLLTACGGSPYSKASGFESETIKEVEEANLDDVGEVDDKIVVSYYQTEDKKNTSFALCEFYFGDGNYVTKKFDGFNIPDAYAADLTGDGKDEIIVILGARSSGYGSSDIHVLEVSGEVNHRPRLVERLTILDGSKDGRTEGVARYKDTLFTITNKSGLLSNASFPDMTDFCGGATVIEGGEDNATLMVYHRLNEQGLAGYTTLVWEENKYVIEEQGFTKKK